MEQTEKMKLADDRKPALIPKKEKVWVLAGAAIAVIILMVGIWNMYGLQSSGFHTRLFKGMFKNYGSLARILLFFVLAYYVVSWIMKKRFLDSWETLKKLAVKVLQLTRKWHTPIAVMAIALIVLHAAGAFLYGFELDFSNISGLLALLVLLPVPISGLLRYRKMDRKWHLRLGLAFGVLFLIHAFL